jgi:uncharacterized lipoprotein YddW (UPF0748 family)
MRYGKDIWMNPGEPGVNERTRAVILDVVRRYDVDGVHIDDYFYPYPEVTRRKREIAFPDGASYNRYRTRGGASSRSDWRRENVNRLVDTLYREIKKTKPWVKFGVSPFGIWRPGSPESVRGFDAYEKLYADSRRWINEGWVDYLSPQLYWKVTAPQQGYGQLLAWWRSENTRGRHVWPGTYTSRVGSEAGTSWSAGEILEQVRLTREGAAAPGNVHFSMSAFMQDRGGLVGQLEAGPYGAPALVPASPWLSPDPPLPPVVRVSVTGGVARLEITSADAPADAEDQAGRSRPPAASLPGFTRSPRWWAIRVLVGGSWRVAIADARQREVALPLSDNGAAPTRVIVSAVDRVGNESPAVHAAATP